MPELLHDVWWRVPLTGLLGLFVGSFLNVLIHRLPKMMEAEWHAQAAELRGETLPTSPPLNLATPRSRCPHCAHPISALQNIPLLSYLLLRGRCAHCKAPIGLRYPLVETASAVLSALAAWYFHQGLALAGALVFVWIMLALTFIDLDTQLLPDSLTLPLLWLGLLLNLHDTYTPLASAVIGAMAGYLALWSVYWAFKLLTGKEGMGFGDFKLLAAIGAWVGWTMLPMVLLISSLVGALTGIAMMVFKGHQRNTPIPFGPYLAAAGLIAFFWGEALTASVF
jgi:leader peptidase (prepilin peptidase) / N-methyltransferase